MKKLMFFTALLALVASAWVSPVFAARSGGTLNFMAPYGGDLSSLNPYTTSRYQDYLVSMNIHRSLYRWDAQKSIPVLDLAESVDISDDGLTYTYKLRPNIKFHNGRKLTSDDIIWSYTHIASMKPASPSFIHIMPIQGAKDLNNGKADTISGLKKIDALTFQMTIENPVDMKFYLWFPTVAILPKEEVEGNEDNFRINPVGCGPFKFVKWVKGSEVIIEKFDDFYMKGLPYLDKVNYKIMGEAAPRDLAFKAKDLDATIVGAVNYPEYLADPVISKNMIEVAEMFTRLVGMNPAFKPFADKRVRQAINHAIPADLIIEKILKGKAFPARGFLPSTSPAFDPNGKKYEYNLDKAKQLMKEAGYEKGFAIEHAIGTANKSWGTGIYEAMMPFLKKINISIKIEQMEGATMDQRIRDGKYQMFIWSLDSGPDPLVVLHRWHSTTPVGSGNYVKYNNPEFDKFLDQAAKERDEAKKIELIKKADAVFTKDAPVWFFNYNKAVMAFHPWVHNLSKVAPEMMFQDLTSVWVDETSPRAK
ncbi:MAG: ABC transporter substrate-binding protein [Desulfobacula sp.]|uniref:ABC transporter substrate-binding protein n=1 Tax=Desulfobacula sp. TaxID=2593537 RepID=UPI0025C66C3E|nr:ABC transporter substrate-binding protein [Desulfobacula sp.]MCD4721307.1 ABC transporter substrate-binding protein [Desulfobacula sp.]